MKLQFKNWLEVTTIANTPEDDEALKKQMFKAFTLAQERGSLMHFGNVNNIEMLSTVYPYGKQIFLISDENPIGFFHLQKNRSNWPNGPDIISLMYILEPYRRTGIGTAIHEFLLKNGYTIQGDSHMTNAMQGLWGKLSDKHKGYEKGDKSFIGPTD